MIYLELFWTFLKIGAFTFGGGYAMIPLIQAEVGAHGWMSAEEVVNFVAVSESTPGPFAVNASTYVGMQTAGFAGAFCATLGVVLPSFIIILAMAGCLDRFRKSRIMSGCMSGLRPAVIGLIGAAAVSTGRTVFFPDGISVTGLGSPVFWISAVIFLAALVPALKKVHPILIILVSAALGVAAGYWFHIL